MKKVITKLNSIGLYPDALMDFEPHMLSVDNHGGKYWVTISNAGTSMYQILNMLDIDYENKPFLKNLLETFNKSEWGVTVNATGNIKSFYVANDKDEFRNLEASFSNSDMTTYDDIVLQEKDTLLQKLFPIRKIYTSRTRNEFPNAGDFEKAFIGVGFYYDYANDKPLVYKHYYDSYTSTITHVYKVREDGSVDFDEEKNTKDFSLFVDGIQIKKEIGPHLAAGSAIRVKEKDKSYLVIQTQKYRDGIV